MPQAQWIFRKDFLRLWGVLAVATPLQVLARWADSSPAAAPMQFITGLFELLAQWFLVVSLIHEEAVPGDRQYWVTRPIAWKDLLLAKAAFILVFIHLPCFLTDAVTLAANGQSIIHFFPALLACQFFLLAIVVLRGRDCRRHRHSRAARVALPGASHRFLSRGLSHRLVCQISNGLGRSGLGPKHRSGGPIGRNSGCHTSRAIRAAKHALVTLHSSRGSSNPKFPLFLTPFSV